MKSPLCMVGKIPWRRKWQPTPVFLPGESRGQRSLRGYSPWGCKKSDTTEQLILFYFYFVQITFVPHSSPTAGVQFNGFYCTVLLCSQSCATIITNSRTFHPLKGPASPPQPLTTRNPLSVSADRPALHVSRQWSHTLCVLLCLPLTERRVLRVRPRGSECQRFSLLQGQVMLLCVEGQVVGLEAPGEALLWPWSWVAGTR